MLTAFYSGPNANSWAGPVPKHTEHCLRNYGLRRDCALSAQCRGHSLGNIQKAKLLNTLIKYLIVRANYRVWTLFVTVGPVLHPTPVGGMCVLFLTCGWDVCTLSTVSTYKTIQTDTNMRQRANPAIISGEAVFCTLLTVCIFASKHVKPIAGCVEIHRNE